MNIYVGNLSYKVRESDLKEVIEEYVKYLSTIVAKRQVMSFSVLYEDGGKRGAIVATGRQISVIAGRA